MCTYPKPVHHPCFLLERQHLQKVLFKAHVLVVELLLLEMVMRIEDPITVRLHPVSWMLSQIAQAT